MLYRMRIEWRFQEHIPKEFPTILSNFCLLPGIAMVLKRQDHWIVRGFERTLRYRFYHVLHNKSHNKYHENKRGSPFIKSVTYAYDVESTLWNFGKVGNFLMLFHTHAIQTGVSKVSVYVIVHPYTFARISGTSVYP